jgi:hypothetical protein
VYDAAELLPAGAAISGWAAAYLLGCSDLDGLGRNGSSREPVLIDLPPPVQMRRREGIGQIRSALADDDVVEVEGLAVTSPLRTAVDHARLSEGREAVVALDAVGRALRVEAVSLLPVVRDAVVVGVERRVGGLVLRPPAHVLRRVDDARQLTATA